MKSNLVDLRLKIHHEAKKAILVSDDGNEENAVWVPLSSIEYTYIDSKKGIIEITIPEWMALDKGLI